MYAVVFCYYTQNVSEISNCLGYRIYEDHNHRLVVKEDGVHSLIISPAKPDDGGEYTIVAESSAGKAISSLQLTVIRK